MLFKQSTLLAALVAVATAAPTAHVGVGTLTKRQTSIPDNVPAPPAGNCALLVFSATILPLGNAPTSTSGEGIGPSEQGNPEAGVINSAKAVVGDFVAVQPQSPGFAASIKLDGSKVSNAGTVTMTADEIATGETDWNVNWKYNGASYTCDGDKCQHYNEYPGGLGAYSVHAGTFPC